MESSLRYEGAAWMVGPWDEDLDAWGPSSWAAGVGVGYRHVTKQI